MNKPLIGIFLSCFAYWTYLIFNAHMVIKFDAIGYEKLGRLIFTEGWDAYFQTGPHREPLYPWLISLSMHISSWIDVSE